MAKDRLLSQAVRSTKKTFRGVSDSVALSISSIISFGEIRRILDPHRIDCSDALHIVMLKSGFYAALVGESRPVLVAADKGLLRAAKSEGILVWNPERDW